MLRFIRVIILFMLVTSFSYAQQQDVSVPTPNATEFTKVVDLPPSTFSGTMGVTLPVCNIRSGRLNMPVTLSHHNTGFKPDEHPGWTGANWNLNIGGAITRRAMGRPDEEIVVFFDGTVANVERFFNPDFVDEQMPAHFNVGRYYEVPETQESATNPLPPIPLGDEADEFIFNFGGYSGKFYFMQDKTGVLTDPANIPYAPENPGFKIEVYPRLKRDLREHTHLVDDDFNTNENELVEQTDYHYYYSFMGFKITTPDGLQYEFGSSWDNLAATEFDAVERSVSLSTPFKNYMTTDAWYLKRIVDIDGTILATFDYIKSLHRPSMPQYSVHESDRRELCQPQITISRTVSYDEIATTDGNGNVEDYQSVYQNSLQTPMHATGIFPIYLKSVETLDQRIELFSSPSSQLEYPYEEARIRLGFQRPLGSTEYSGWISKLTTEWLQLDKVVITDLAQNKLVKSFDFTYSSDPKVRLQLKSMKEDGKPPYRFEYNGTAAALIPYASFAVDPWGYYNGRAVPGFLDTFFGPGRAPQNITGVEYTWRGYTNDYQGRSFSTLEEYQDWAEDLKDDFIEWESRTLLPSLYHNKLRSLRAIHYPTGGYVEYEYELNSAVSSVEGNADNLEYELVDFPQERSISGIRVKNIKYFDADGSLERSVSYNYEQGILKGKPVLFNTTLCRTSHNGGLFDFFSYGTRVPFAENGSGSHVTYSKVAQVNEGTNKITGVLNEQGRTETYFRNFRDDPSLYIDITDDKHIHLPSIYAIPSCSPRTIIKNTGEQPDLGKVLAVRTFNETGQLLSEERNYYLKGQTWFYDNTGTNNYNDEFQNPYPLEEDMYRILSFKAYTADLAVQITPRLDVFGAKYMAMYRQYFLPVVLDKKVNKTRDAWGNETVVETKYKYMDRFYNEVGFHVSPLIRSEEKVINNDISYTTQYRYTSDFNEYTGTLSQYQDYKALNDQGFTTLPVEQLNIQAKGSSPPMAIGGQLFNYKPGTPFVSSTQSLDLANPSSYQGVLSNTLPHTFYEPSKTLDYDSRGNITHINDERADVDQSYFYGYENSLPVLQGTNISYVELSSKLAEALNATGYTTLDELLDALNNLETETEKALHSTFVQQLRNFLPNSFFTFYTHSPQVGLTSQTDQNGLSTFYEYDEFNRLKFVRDNDGNIVQSTNYNYRKQ